MDIDKIGGSPARPSVKNLIEPRNKRESGALTGDVTVQLSKAGKQASAMALTAKEILAGINKAIGLDPEQLESFKDRTPDSTADFVIGGLKNIFAKLEQAVPDEDKEAFVKKFFEDARSGISKGYEEAFTTLEALGAFNIEGVQSSVEQTRLSIDSKLVEFETEILERFNFTDKSDESKETSEVP